MFVHVKLERLVGDQVLEDPNKRRVLRIGLLQGILRINIQIVSAGSGFHVGFRPCKKRFADQKLTSIGCACNERWRDFFLQRCCYAAPLFHL